MLRIGCFTLLCVLSTVSGFAADNAPRKGTLPKVNTKNILIYEKMSNLWKQTPGVPVHIGYLYTVRGEKYRVIGIDSFHFDLSQKMVLLTREDPAPAKPNWRPDPATPVKAPTILFTGKNLVLTSTVKEDTVYSEGATFDSPSYELKNWYHVPETQLLEIEGPGKQKQTIALKDFTQEMENSVQKITVWNTATPKKLIAVYERLKKWDTKQSLLFNMTPEESNVYTFKLGTGSNAHEVKVYAPHSPTPGQDERDLVKIKELVEKTPVALQGYIEVIHFDPGQNGAGLAASTSSVVAGKTLRQLALYLKEDEPTVSVVSDILSRPHIEETYWHELGHDLQEKVPSLLPGFDWSVWEDAIVKDQNWVTPYAMTQTSEDFPETLARYIGTNAGKTDPMSRKNYSHRFEILDQIFALLPNKS